MRLSRLLLCALPLVTAACSGDAKNADTVAVVSQPVPQETAPTAVVGGDTALSAAGATGDSAGSMQIPATTPPSPEPEPNIAAAANTQTASAAVIRPAGTTITRTRPDSARAPVADDGPTFVASGDVGSEKMVGRIAKGSEVTVVLAAEVCTMTAKAGDEFDAIVGADVTGTHDAVIPTGSAVRFRLVEFARAENITDKARITVRPTGIVIGGRFYDLQAESSEPPFETRRPEVKSSGLKGAVIGALGGFLAARIRGDSKEDIQKKTAAGAVAGGAVGVAVADTHICLKPNSPFQVRLNESLEMQKP